MTKKIRKSELTAAVRDAEHSALARLVLDLSDLSDDNRMFGPRVSRRAPLPLV